MKNNNIFKQTETCQKMILSLWCYDDIKFKRKCVFGTLAFDYEGILK